MRKEGRCGQDDHGRVDCPAHAHRKERVEELIAQTLFDNLLALAFEMHGLDDLGVQEEVVGHNDRAYEGDNPALGTLVGARHEHRHRYCCHDDAAGTHGQSKEHLERDRTAQDFGHGGGDRG